MAAVYLADPLGNVIQEVAVMGDGEYGAGVVLQEVLQPQYGLGVQVVGGLVQKQQVGSLEEQLAQRDATALAAGKDVDGHIRIGQLQRVHGDAQLGVDIPAVGGIDLVLQAAHLGHQGVHIGIGIAHLLADLVEAVDLGKDVAKRHADVFNHGLVIVQRGLLLKDAHGVAGGKTGIAIGDLLDACHDLEQG